MFVSTVPSLDKIRGEWEREDGVRLWARPRSSAWLLPRRTVTKYFSHTSLALAAKRVRDGVVTERLNGEGTSQPHL